MQRSWVARTSGSPLSLTGGVQIMQRSWVAQSSGSPPLSLSFSLTGGVQSMQRPWVAQTSGSPPPPSLSLSLSLSLTHWWSTKYAEILGCPVIRIPLSLTGGVQSNAKQYIWHQFTCMNCQKGGKVDFSPPSWLHSGFSCRVYSLRSQ